jgi:holo-[acyl-carrier protein] synthase
MTGLGIDVVDVPRFREALERTPSLLGKLFTDEEQEYGARSNDPAPSLAVRFAAKEATMKALGVGLGAFGFHDVSVSRGAKGAPVLVVVGAAADLAAEKGVTSWKVSLSHTCSVATAVVIAE